MSSIPVTNDKNQIREYHADRKYKQIGEINTAIAKAVKNLGYDSGCGIDEFQPAEIEGDGDQIGHWDVYVPCNSFDQMSVGGSTISIDKFAQHMKAKTFNIRKAILTSHPAIISVEDATFWGVSDFHFMKDEKVEGDSAYNFNFRIKCSVEEIWKLMYPFERKDEAAIPGPRVELAGYRVPGEYEPTVLWSLRLARAVLEDASCHHNNWNYRQDSFIPPTTQMARRLLINTKGISIDNQSIEQEFSRSGAVTSLIDSIDHEISNLFNIIGE